MAKKLKFWNGAVFYKGTQHSVSVAAHSVAEMREILESVDIYNVTPAFVRTYFSNCWGYQMKEQVRNPTVGVWVKPIRSDFKTPYTRIQGE